MTDRQTGFSRTPRRYQATLTTFSHAAPAHKGPQIAAQSAGPRYIMYTAVQSFRMILNQLPCLFFTSYTGKPVGGDWKCTRHTPV